MTTSDGTVQGHTQIFGSAPRNRAFTIVLLADGFTAAQQNDFNNACTAFLTALRATPPYTDLMPAINVFRVNVASTDSGADDPASGGGTGATARTYFDSTFRRQQHPPAAGVQHHHRADRGRRAGAGVHAWCSWSSTRPSMAAAADRSAPTRWPVARPRSRSTRSGHTAYGLADEYPYYAGGAETGHDHHPAGEPGEPNVTTNTNRATLKWRWAVARRDGASRR